MSEIKRYEPTYSQRHGQRMLLVANGDWMKHSDHLARIAQLEAQAQKLRERVHVLEGECTRYDREVKELSQACSDYRRVIAQKKAGEA